MSTAYHLALNTNRWRMKRVEIKAKHRYECDDCHLRRARLEVHHIEYERGRAPWDYPDENFAVLCRNCHERRHNPPDQNGQLLLFPQSELMELMVRPSIRRTADNRYPTSPAARSLWNKPARFRQPPTF